MFTEVSTYISGKMLNFGDTEEYLLELDAAHIELTGHCTYWAMTDATGAQSPSILLDGAGQEGPQRPSGGGEV